MAYELREGQGSLFKNTYKKEGDKTPDYRGTALFNGKKIKVAAWIKEGKNGKFFSLSIQKDTDFGGEHKNEPLAEGTKESNPSGAPEFDDCPF